MLTITFTQPPRMNTPSADLHDTNNTHNIRPVSGSSREIFSCCPPTNGRQYLELKLNRLDHERGTPLIWTPSQNQIFWPPRHQNEDIICPRALAFCFSIWGVRTIAILLHVLRCTITYIGSSLSVDSGTRLYESLVEGNTWSTVRVHGIILAIRGVYKHTLRIPCILS